MSCPGPTLTKSYRPCVLTQTYVVSILKFNLRNAVEVSRLACCVKLTLSVPMSILRYFTNNTDSVESAPDAQSYLKSAFVAFYLAI